ncbi:hypothetical protein B0H16DRAFT_1449528 [Mycena metata]|uniref:Uncharacterized protein n=1 Tax=Mycena metata TaxID=1033252 RepID=A0AAD7NW34_9AGAR|nr:hypothetical protein B0H16DRAFT_1449528 [Mycena metata]
MAEVASSTIKILLLRTIALQKSDFAFICSITHIIQLLVVVLATGIKIRTQMTRSEVRLEVNEISCNTFGPSSEYFGGEMLDKCCAIWPESYKKGGGKGKCNIAGLLDGFQSNSSTYHQNYCYAGTSKHFSIIQQVVRNLRVKRGVDGNAWERRGYDWYDEHRDQDRWMAVDFAILRDLFSEADTSVWFSTVKDENNWRVPHAERLELDPSVLSETPVDVVDLPDLKTRFLHAVTRSAAGEDDIVVLILCGHGDEHTGDLVIGGKHEHRDPLAKKDIELALSTLAVPRQRVFIISIACHSGLWRSDRWTLFAASDSHQTSAAMSTSSSGEGRGSVFTYALLAQRANEHGLTAPHPVRKVDLPGGKGPVVCDTPGKATMLEADAGSKGMRSSTEEVLHFMETLKTTMGGTYKDGDFVLSPASSLRPFTSEFLPRLQVVEPSVPADSGTDEPEGTVGAIQSDAEEIRPLTSAEKMELRYLAIQYDKIQHANVALDVAVNIMAARVARGADLEPQSSERILLAKLRYRDVDSRRASTIAEHFGWKAQGDVGQWAHGNGLREMLEAQAHGAAIATDFFLGPGVGAQWWDAERTSVNSHRRRWKTMGPGAWLANTWIEAGRPTVAEKDWEQAVRVLECKKRKESREKNIKITRHSAVLSRGSIYRAVRLYSQIEPILSTIRPYTVQQMLFSIDVHGFMQGPYGEA